MKRVLSFLVLALTLSSCYKDQLREIHDEITQIRDVEVADLQHQADQISGSIQDLNKLTDSLKIYLITLEQFKGNFGKDMQEVSTLLESFKASAGTDIISSKKNMITLIDNMGTSVVAKYDELGKLIDALEAKDETIKGQITDLKTYMDGLYARSDWANATLATLEKQNEIIKNVDGIKAQIETIQKTTEALKQQLSGYLESELSDWKKEFGEKLGSEAEVLLKKFESALSNMNGEVTSHFSDAVKNAVEDCDKGLKTWINEKLTEYYTVASAQAQIEAFKLLIGNVPEGNTLQGEIEDLQKELADTEKNIIEQYTKAIKEAIEKYEGRITDEMDKRLQTLDNDTITPLSNRLTPIQSAITQLWLDAASLKTRINTVSEQSRKIAQSIAVLSDLNKTLEQYVGEMVAELEKTDEDNKKDLEARIDALKQVMVVLQNQITSLKSYVGTLPEGTATDVATWIQTTFNTLNAQFDNYSTISAVDQIIAAINARISGHDTDIANLTNALDELIDGAKSTIEGWISERLTAYTAAADADALLSTLETELTTLFTNGDAALQLKIEQVKGELNSMKSGIEQGYKSLITQSIETEQGKLSAEIQTKAESINSDISALLEKAGGIETELDAMISKVSELKGIIDTKKTDLTTLQTFLKVNNYPTLAAMVADLLSKIDNLSTQYASKSDLDSLYTYVTTDLKTESERIAGLVSRMKDVTLTTSKLTAFMIDVDLSQPLQTTLKATLDQILNQIKTMETTVNGTQTTPSLTTQIEAIEEALYGELRDPESPSDDSICGMIDYLMKVLVTGSFSSITYIPRYFDQTETLNYSASKGVSASFNFVVKPASIARFYNEAAFKECFKMRFVKDGIMYDFKNQTIEVYEDGTISIDVLDDRYDLLKSGASAALYVTSEDEALPSFTSKFIPLEDINGSTILSASVGTLRFSPDAGTKPISITAEESFYVYSCPSWVNMPSSDGTHVIWVGADRRTYPKYNSCTDKTFNISVEANSTFSPRSGDIVLISTSNSDVVVKIHVEQEGNKVLYSDIPASGGVFNSSNIYTFTLYNKDVNYPYIYLSERESFLDLEQLGYYISVQYDDGTGVMKDFPTSKSGAIKIERMVITVDATNFHFIKPVASVDTRITFTTLSDSSSSASEGSGISFYITTYHLLYQRNKEIR